jgi:hypothetical protein
LQRYPEAASLVGTVEKVLSKAVNALSEQGNTDDMPMTVLSAIECRRFCYAKGYDIAVAICANSWTAGCV